MAIRNRNRRPQHLLPHHLILILVGFVGIAISSTASAQKQNASEEFLAGHNQARAAVGVGPLKWSMKLATDASLMVRYQRDKMGCKFADLSKSKYGSNQMWMSGPVSLATPAAAVGSWVEEKKYYDHATNSCIPNHQCLSYTQVVWNTSSDLGCAQATCVKPTPTTITICLYDPPGNFIGQSPY
ncbi:PREDICTED: STS14 protein [Nelumbo nucifera]|uniref:STS14 protein n=1 Tax=Nelumbo nucifera TaxID=4432 RepID=A0A1U7YSS1_NELNU|nr:PREDICTED: STS14 protein [Nelumbo nucifera]